MLKRQELTDPNSCMSKAHDDELIFVLLERDEAAPVAVRAWVEERIRLGLNERNDAKIAEALEWASNVAVIQSDCIREAPYFDSLPPAPKYYDSRT